MACFDNLRHGFLRELSLNGFPEEEFKDEFKFLMRLLQGWVEGSATTGVHMHKLFLLPVGASRRSLDLHTLCRCKWTFSIMLFDAVTIGLLIL